MTATCPRHGKIGYATRGVAERVIRDVKKSPRGGGAGRVGLAAYRCDDCHDWHIGNSDASKRRRS